MLADDVSALVVRERDPGPIMVDDGALRKTGELVIGDPGARKPGTAQIQMDPNIVVIIGAQPTKRPIAIRIWSYSDELRPIDLDVTGLIGRDPFAAPVLDSCIQHPGALRSVQVDSNCPAV